MTDRELMQQALDALDEAANVLTWNGFAKTADALRERLAQPEQEPVAHVYLFDPNGKPRVAWDNAKNIKIGTKLYTAPQPRQWVGLTEEEENKLWESTDSDWELMKRTEAKLREKNA